MNDLTIVLCAVVLVLGMLLYKAITCIQNTLGPTLRSREREATSHLNLIERLTEKRDAPSGQVLTVDRKHSDERMHKAVMDTELEKSNNQPKVIRRTDTVPMDSHTFMNE